MGCLRLYIILFVILKCLFFVYGKPPKGKLPHKEKLKWPTQFHFKGETLDLVSGLNDPFELWHNEDNGTSRIDLYGGTVQKYFNVDIGECYSIHPKTTEEILNDIVCATLVCEDEEIDLLPETKGLKYAGRSKTLFDIEVDIWTSTDDSDEPFVTKSTVYVHKADDNYYLPVQEREKKYHAKLGRVYRHTVTNFYGFEPDVDEAVFRPSLDTDECEYSWITSEHLKTESKFSHFGGDVDKAFDIYKKNHKKNYHEKEASMRKSIFKKNFRLVEEHNRKNLSYRMELNAFSDRTKSELKHLTGSFVPKGQVTGAKQFPYSKKALEHLVKQLPENFDLRMQGFVTSVKNQGVQCGSCWAFAASAAVETAFARRNGGRLFHLSEQATVDCAWGFGNYGCDGGYVGNTMKYVLKYGIPTELDYGLYIENDGYCKISNMSSTIKIQGFAQVTPRNAIAMKVALYKYGAVAATIYSSDTMLQYSDGIFYDFSCTKAKSSRLNHAVTVVGYGVREGQDYWLVKNSWGEAWGQDGYILMSARNNNCFVLDEAYYPII